MDNLISGLIGALLATLLSVLYLHVAEVRRRRYGTTLRVIEYSDEIYNLMQVIHAHKESVYLQNKPHLDEDTYKIVSDRLRVLVLSSKVHAQVTLTFGEESSDTEDFSNLKIHYMEVGRLTWRSNKENWYETAKIMTTIFSEKIDPLRHRCEVNMIRSVKVYNIFIDFISGIWPFKLFKHNK